MNNCLNCIYFTSFPVQDKEKKDTIGACRANPPQIDFANKNKIARFPTVLGSMWCGSFTSGEDIYSFVSL